MAANTNVYGIDFAQWFDVIYTTLPDTLKPDSPACLQHIAAISPPFTFFGGLEFRLLAGQQQVDIGIGYRTEHAPILADFLKEAIATNPHYRHPGWACIQQFAADWQVGELNAGISRIMLEMDIPADGASDPTPNNFFFSDFTCPFESLSAVTRQAISYMVSEEETRRLSNYLQPCYDALQPGDVWRGVGVMARRDMHGVRAILALDTARVLPYLRSIGWAGDGQTIEDIVQLSQSFEGPVMLYIDVGERIGPRVGLGTFMVDYQNQTTYPDNLKLLDLLVDRGLCSPARADALQRLGRHLIFPLTLRAPWPDALIVDSLQRPANHFSQVYHYPLNVKISHTPGQPLEAKAYTGFHQLWREA